jgi:predicted small secreted protein
MLKKWTIIFALLFSVSFILSAQQTSNGNAGREIKNLVSAVKTASPGDYIVLPSGKRYVLTKEEIDILKGNFDYGDLSGVETETRSDGTEIKTISESHTAFIYADGQSR